MHVQKLMSAWAVMVDVSTTVPTLMAALTVLVTLDMHWTVIWLTAQVI